MEQEDLCCTSQNFNTLEVFVPKLGLASYSRVTVYFNLIQVFLENLAET